MNKKGFTLVELMLVIVIIGIISVITIPNIMEALDDSRKESGSSMEETLKKDLELYNTDHREDLWDESEYFECREISFAELRESNPDINLGECLLNNQVGYLTIVKTYGDKCSDDSSTTPVTDDEDDVELSKNAKYTYYVGVTCGKELKKITDQEFNNLFTDEEIRNQVLPDKNYMASSAYNSQGKKGNVYFNSKSVSCAAIESGTQETSLELHIGQNSLATFTDCEAGDSSHCSADGKVYTITNKDGLMPGQHLPDFPEIDPGILTFVEWKDEHGVTVSENSCYDPSSTILTAHWRNDVAPDIEVENLASRSSVVNISCSEEGSKIKSYYAGKGNPETATTGWVDFGYEREENEKDVTITEPGTYNFACKDTNGKVTKSDTSLTFHEITLKMERCTLKDSDGNQNTTVKKFASSSVGINLPSPKTSVGYTTVGSWYSDRGYSSSVGTYGSTYKPAGNVTLYTKADVTKYNVSVEVVNGTGPADQEVPHGQGVNLTLTPDANFINPTYECDSGTDATLNGNVLSISNVTSDTHCKVVYHDTIRPNSVSFNSTNNVADHQTATLSCSDNTKIISYYFGNNAPTSASSYTAVNPVPTLTVTKNIDEDKLYYFACKDTDGNVSEIASARFYETSFIMEDGTIQQEEVITMNGNSFALPTPAASVGYTTLGKWYSDEEFHGEGKNYASSFTPSQSSTLYSGSTINTSKLTINPNGGKIEVSPEDGDEEEITTTKDYTQDYNTILSYSKPVKDSVVDTSEHYTVSYNTDGAGTVASQTSVITKTTIYTFTGFTKSDPFYGTLSSINNAGTYKYPADNNVTSSITANYSNNVQVNVASVNLASAPTKAGHTFRGWKSSADNQTYSAGVSYTPAADVTMTAQWEINNYTVSVAVNNGTLADDEESSKTVVYDHDVTFETVSSLEEAPGSVSCTNGQNATIDNGVVTVTHVNNDTVCTVTYKTEMTVLFNDGTLIINELPNHRNANVTSHGTVLKEYEPLSASNAYVFLGDDSRALWYDERANITKIEIGHTIKPTSTRMWFHGLFNLESGNFTNLDMSDVTDMYSMFDETGSTVSSYALTGLSSWNLANVTNMGNLFHGAGSGASTWNIGDLSNWNTANVVSMGNVFNGAGQNASTFNIGNLSDWNTGNVTDMASMFASCGYNSATWNIGDLSGWNVENVQKMNAMFSGAGQSTTTTWNIGNLNNWKVGHVEYMNAMFNDAGKSAATWNVGDLSNWDTSYLNYATGMFQNSGASASVWNVGDLSGWDVSHVNQAVSMFAGAGASANQFILNVSGWDFANYDNVGFGNFFADAGKSATKFELDVSNWKHVKGGLFRIFEGAGSSATDWQIKGLPTWNVSEVTNTERMLAGAGAHATTWSVGDLSSWNLVNATSTSEMFKGINFVGTFNSIGTLKIYATKLDSIFNETSKAKATLQLYTNPTSYSNAFTSAATDTTALITVDYKNSVTNIDNIIATKSTNSNVVKGSVIN